MVGVEEGCQALEDSLLVGVEPLALVVGEHLHEDGRGQDGTEGQVLEGVVGTEGDAFGGGNDEEGVFVAHTMTAFDVDAGFVGDGHAWKEGGGAPLHAELVEVDGFMYRHELTHPMTGAVQVVDAVFPHGFTGKYIELGATGAFGEDRRTQTDPTFEYEGVVATHLPREGTQWDGTCDVGGAIEVLTP